MNLPLDIVRTTGRARREVTASFVRDLVPEDLLLLGEEKGVKPSPLKRLSERHHSLARHIASGMSMQEAAAITGYDISRISILKDDPTFKELVQFYLADVQRQYAGLHEVMAGMATDALLELRQRLEDEPEKFTIGSLLEVGKMGADRTGFGPTSKTEVNVNVGIASRLEEARARVKSRLLELRPNQE